MVPTYVPIEAELLVRRTLTAQGATLPAPVIIGRIELFVHALDARKLIFGTAEINGVVTALPEHLLESLDALHKHLASRPLHTRSTAKMPLMARTWATTRRS
jgi:hypothetical protein